MTAIALPPLSTPATGDGLGPSVSLCRDITRRSGSSFYHGMRLIPEPTRTDTFVLYAWLRVADDLADEPGDPADKRRRLRQFWQRTCRTASSAAFETVCTADDLTDLPRTVEQAISTSRRWPFVGRSPDASAAWSRFQFFDRLFGRRALATAGPHPQEQHAGRPPAQSADRSGSFTFGDTAAPPARMAPRRRQLVSGVEDTPTLWPALADLLRRRPLPIDVMRDVVAAQLTDLTTRSYATLDDLRRYCYGVASTVGLLCVTLWGFDDTPAARALAIERGIAFQLTNILRDVREDALAGRVYLPTELAGEPITSGDVLAGAPHVGRAIDAVAVIAEAAYLRSAALDDHVAPAARSCLWAMTERYHALLNKITANPTAVLSRKRVRLSSAAKLSLIARAALR